MVQGAVDYSWVWRYPTYLHLCKFVTLPSGSAKSTAKDIRSSCVRTQNCSKFVKGSRGNGKVHPASWDAGKWFPLVIQQTAANGDSHAYWLP